MARYLNVSFSISRWHSYIRVQSLTQKCKTHVCIYFSIQLGNGETGTDVRVRNNRLHCQNCYSNDEGKHWTRVICREKEREGLKSTLLISLISTNFLLACFSHHTFSFLNGGFSFLFKDHFLSVFHSFIWCIFRFEIQQSLELRANQFNTHKIHWQEGFKLVVRNKAVSNSTNSSGKIVFKII